jgi:hypothetical protein
MRDAAIFKRNLCVTAEGETNTCKHTVRVRVCVCVYIYIYIYIYITLIEALFYLNIKKELGLIVHIVDKNLNEI